jgi:hypothetical protein
MKLIQKYSDLVILTIIWIISIYSVIIAVIDSYNIGIQNYIGYGLLIGISVLRFLKVKKFKTILGIFLIVGSINLFQFTYSTISLVLSWTPLGHRFLSFGFQPLSISLLIFFLIANFSEFIHLLTDLFSEDPKVEFERQKRIATRHYDALKNEKDSELQTIIDNKSKYQIESVEAAKRLIEERKNQ